MKTIIIVSIAILCSAYLIGSFAEATLDITKWAHNIRVNCAIGAAIAIAFFLLVRWSTANKSV